MMTDARAVVGRALTDGELSRLATVAAVRQLLTEAKEG
jgi:hypothetical protein